MKGLVSRDAVYLGHHPERGRGVYAARSFAVGQSVEWCPVIVLSPNDFERIHTSELHDYYFLWEKDRQTAIALGYGSLYNHGEPANADYRMHFAERLLEVYATAAIEAGAEILIDYTDGASRDNLWFTPK